MRSPGPVFDLRKALAAELHAATEELEGAELSPQAAHRCRVHLKRARALARLGSAGAPGLAAVFNDSARAVMRQLAKARDLAALAEAARAIAAKESRRDATALEAVADALDAERAASSAVNLQEAHSGLRDLAALAQVWPEASARQIRRGAKRIIRRARTAWRRGRGSDDAKLRHTWRKREKDRYYAADILHQAWPEQRRRKLGKKLGEAIGGERDASLLLDRLKAEPALASGAKSPDRANRAIKRRKRKLAQNANALGRRLHMQGA